MNIFDFQNLLGINADDLNEATQYLYLVSSDRSDHHDPLKIALACVAVKIKKLEKKLAEK